MQDYSRETNEPGKGPVSVSYTATSCPFLFSIMSKITIFLVITIIIILILYNGQQSILKMRMWFVDGEVEEKTWLMVCRYI